MNVATLRCSFALLCAFVLAALKPDSEAKLASARTHGAGPATGQAPSPAKGSPAQEPSASTEERIEALEAQLIAQATPSRSPAPAPILPEASPAVLGDFTLGKAVLTSFVPDLPKVMTVAQPVGPALPAPPAPVLPPANPSVNALPELVSDGYWIENAPINEIFQYLARSSQQQYFFNNELSGPEFNVTGHLKLSDAKKQMDELAVAYGLSVYEQGTTIYLMTDAQLARLPVEVMCYTLKYLRGSQPGGSTSGAGSSDAEGGGHGGSESSGAGMADFEKLKSIIKPMLTKDMGQIEFEEKNNVLLVTDNKVRLQKVRDLLEQLDRPKQQIVINVRILRVRKNHGSKIGVDWSGILGDGLPISASQSLNALFGLPDSATLTKTLSASRDLANSFTRSRDTITGNDLPSDITTTNDTTTRDSSTNSLSESIQEYTDGAGLVFGALDMEAIVHALKEHDFVTQEACPTIITEDNEQGIISIVDRFPLITSNVVATTTGTNVTDEVRYKIDEEDPNASDEPQKSREIGVTLSVTPTLLPDGTVRMRLRPRVANIVDFVPGQTGNVFPRVSESTIEGISRIPKGQSLFLGGFYDSSDNSKNSKVPVLGSIPLLNKLFGYHDKSNSQISLVFIITPRVYDASSAEAVNGVNAQVQLNSGFNRTDPAGLSTPVLPKPETQNNFLPLPTEADPAADKKRNFFSRMFPKKTGAEPGTVATTPAPPGSATRPKRAFPPR